MGGQRRSLGGDGGRRGRHPSLIMQHQPPPPLLGDHRHASLPCMLPYTHSCRHAAAIHTHTSLSCWYTSLWSWGHTSLMYYLTNFTNMHTSLPCWYTSSWPWGHTSLLCYLTHFTNMLVHFTVMLPYTHTHTTLSCHTIPYHTLVCILGY